MSSRYETPIDLTDDALDNTRESLIIPSSTGLPNAFGRIIAASITAIASSFHEALVRQRDTCQRPEPTYNDNYNPFKAPLANLDPRYSPYTNREPLYNNRLIITLRIPRGHVLTIRRRPRTQ